MILMLVSYHPGIDNSLVDSWNQMQIHASLLDIVVDCRKLDALPQIPTCRVKRRYVALDIQMTQLRWPKSFKMSPTTESSHAKFLHSTMVCWISWTCCVSVLHWLRRFHIEISSIGYQTIPTYHKKDVFLTIKVTKLVVAGAASKWTKITRDNTWRQNQHQNT